MTDNQKFLTGIILGAAAGVAITLFLQSEKGKEILSGVKDWADDATDGLKEKMDQFDDSVAELVKKGKQFVTDLGETKESL